MKRIATCVSKHAQQPGVKDTPIMVVFNGPRGSVVHMDCNDEDEANQFKLHGKYQVEVTEILQ